MDKSKHQTEYATQFFDFVPRSLVDDISEGSNELVQESLVQIKNRIIKKYDGKVEPSNIEESVKRIEDKYLLEMDTVYEKLSSFLCAHVLKVPGHVLLPEDKVWDPEQQSSSSSAKLTNINVELESLRSKIKTAIYKKTVLKQSLENIQEIVMKQEDKLQSDEEMFNNYNIKDWQDMVDFTNQNREALNKKIETLQKLTGDELCDVDDEKLSLFGRQKQSDIKKRCEEYLDNNCQETVTNTK